MTRLANNPKHAMRAAPVTSPGDESPERIGSIVVISPCRDEEEHVVATIESMAAQTVRPSLWVIVDDGSTDRTPEILAEAARQYPWIRVLRRDNRGERAVGPGVIEAFYAGLETVNLDEYEYVCKLDADLVLPEGYFERLIEEFDKDPCLGNMSGKIYLQDDDGRLILERMGDENAVGAAKFYRTACFRDIGGFARQVSWDGIDGHVCRMKGWVARSENWPELRIIHRRLMGSSHKSIWHGRLRWGRGKWYMGSAWYFVVAVAAYRLVERPFIIGGIGILAGYFAAMLKRAPRYGDRAFRKHLRRFELKSLLHGKRRTADRYHDSIRRGAQGLVNHQRRERGVKILAIASGGGHWVELIRLRPSFEDHVTVYVTVSEAYREDVGDAKFYTVRDATRWNKFGLLVLAAQIMWIILRERPDVVVSTGAAPGYFAIRLARLIRAKTVWLDSIANVDRLSMSGERAGRLCDLWMTQWPHLARTGGPEYRGQVL